MGRLLTPPARLLIRLGVSPDTVTWVGTIVVVVVALSCFPRGWLWQGALVVLVVAVADMMDGQMARLSGRSSTWGAFLDSTLDRFGDAAVFGGILLYFAGREHSVLWAGVTLIALVTGQVTSYVRARAEALSFDAKGGLAARADRLVIVLVGAALSGLGLPYALQIAVGLLAVLGAVTVGQRMDRVRRQAHAFDSRVRAEQR